MANEPSILTLPGFTVNVLTMEEYQNFERIMNQDIVEESKSEYESITWNSKHTTRKRELKEMTETLNDNKGYHNKYGFDYRRKEEPLLLFGLKECHRYLSRDRLRFLVIAAIDKTQPLGYDLLCLCLSKNIPILPLNKEVTELSKYLPNHKSTQRVCCMGVTKKTVQSKSVMSSLLYLENYYRITPHVTTTYSLKETKLELLTKKKTQKNKKQVKKAGEGYCRLSEMNWSCFEMKESEKKVIQRILEKVSNESIETEERSTENRTSLKIIKRSQKKNLLLHYL